MPENRLNAYFSEHGESVRPDGGTPFSLAGTDAVWLVVSGRVDVFLVQEGGGRGERTPCYSAWAGHAVFGHKDRPGVSLLAVGTPGTEVRRLTRAGLEGLDPEAMARLVDDHLDLLAGALARNIESAPEAGVILAPGRSAELPRLTVARSDGAPVWVRHIKGASLFMGMQDLDVETGWIPVPAAAWVQALADAELEQCATVEIMRRKDRWALYERCQQTVLACLSLGAAFASADRLAALREKSAADVRVTRNGLLRLASIMDDTIVPPSPGAGDDALASACAMAARALGADMDGLEGPLTGRTVEEVAESGNLRARRVLLRGRWFREDGGPLVAFTAGNRHPVALLPVSPRAYRLHDPRDGSVRPVTAETAEGLEPAAYSLYRPLPPTRLRLRDIPLFGLHGSWRGLIQVGVLGGVLGLVGLITPLLTRTIFNDVIPGADRSRLLQVVAILLGFTVASLLFEVAKSIAMLRVKMRTDHNLETAIWARLLRMPANFFRKFSAGDLAQRAMALNTVQQMLSGASLSSMFSAFFSLIYLAQLFYFDTKLALLALLIVLVSALATALVSAVQIRYQRKAVDLGGQISGQTLQFISGVSKLRAGGAEDRALMLWADKFAEQRRISYKLGSVGNAFSAFNSAFGTIGSALIFTGVVYFERETPMDMGTFMAFWAAFGGLQSGILSLVGAVTSVFKAVPYFERLRPILEEAPENAEAKGNPGEIRGNIEVANVSFRYGDDGAQVLTDVSFTVRPGEFVAVTGPSGSGKTTLLRLLLGFEAPNTGAILYEGQDLGQLDAAKVRRQMGVVLQNGGLMPGDIFTNIIGASTLTLDDAWRAAEMAGFAEDIKAMPMGMHTVISEGASTLSGGQRQRLIIARALARDPKVLLFDEATSALDNRTQDIVTRSLNDLPVTRVVIAHRLSTIKDADRIIVLRDGRIAESGTYAELMAAGGVFHDLAKRQMS
ncbi:NHLP bacteriocin export ABC transporter permease/ATPase subunit [Pseudodesulfovibrio sp.]|uniref:NHLP bacteriocin export ABC transporter permease/ATPase subunit n=1 Tax=Pseudodesulfovibrio sp. TaxID=2035812 RepID=UPI0026097E8B|nr:NHLP bacteriocin export ABC transporter permease/ATPase subunit [Pseudodesulfovibrio sp.]MDD3311409.1 NHLP bacteriocin export ABC transporter permease/ATPase subunit [Pseudodesulfovibrio sp.]